MPGEPVSESVSNQEADFFRIVMREDWQKYGVVIRCKSTSMSKFKLVLFDRDGTRWLSSWTMFNIDFFISKIEFLNQNCVQNSGVARNFLWGLPEIFQNLPWSPLFFPMPDSPTTSLGLPPLPTPLAQNPIFELIIGLKIEF